jgi:hypothetical protein
MRFLNREEESGYPAVIVQNHPPLSEKEIELAFKGSETTQWYRALMQVMETTRQDYIERASGGADRNNPLGMARDLGAGESLSALMLKLSELSSGG